MGQGFKQASLGGCILKAIKPNSVLPPLLFGLGVENNHGIGLKTRLTEISKLGYAEVISPMMKLSDINSQSRWMKTTN